VIRIDVHPTGETRPTRHVRFPRQSTYAQCTLPAGGPRMWQPFAKSSTAMDRAAAPEKKGSRHNLQRAGWPIRGSIPSFSHVPAIEAVGVKPSSVGNQLLGLPGPYHRHAIDMFNICSRGPIERSSTDLGGGYNPWRCRLVTYPLLDLPNQLSPLSPNDPARSPF
jgi:hypothetical protein